MVNTRILEGRLGWGSGSKSQGTDPRDDSETVVHLPEMRSIGHEPLLQGRVAVSRRGGAFGMPRSDIDAAWQGLTCAANAVDDLKARTGALHSMDPQSAAGFALDQLRAQMLRVMKERRWRRIGVTAPQRGSGASFVAAGLAASVARLSSMRVALLDMDLTGPSLASHLGLPVPPHFGDVLQGVQPPEAQLFRIGDNLAVMTRDTRTEAMDETALCEAAGGLLKRLTAALAPDLIIVDLPPLRESASLPAMLSALDTVLVVADGTRHTAQDISACEATLENLVPLMGVVLNKSEDKVARPGRRARR